MRLLFRSKFARQITVILLIKTILIYTVWAAFFKPHVVHVSNEKLAERIFGEDIQS